MKITLVCYKYGLPLDDPCCYPLGFMYVSSSLKQQGHEVKVLNYNLFDYDFVEEVKDQDVVMFTGFEEFYSSIVRDSKICRELGIRTVLGGALATFKTEKMQELVDEVFIGEFPEKSKIDQLPWPDYEGFGIKEYHKRHETNFMGVLTSRGCPFNCTFCSQVCRFKMRNLNDVFDEILFYKEKYKVETIVFYDNTFNVSKRRFLTICEFMQKAKLTWSAAIRCDIFDEEMVKVAKESGCLYFVVGVESFNQEKLDRMNKKVKVESIIKTLDLLHKYEVNYHGNILLGFENETFEDICKELEEFRTSYNLFPVLVQPYVGGRNGKSRLITQEQEDFFNSNFIQYVESKGKYQYPALEEI